uniref:Uncharacterized protein n=1 Tax=Anopheles quadriannulatus TaxID=34691 RepID=A0A182XRX7_ANOQN
VRFRHVDRLLDDLLHRVGLRHVHNLLDRHLDDLFHRVGFLLDHRLDVIVMMVMVMVLDLDLLLHDVMLADVVVLAFAHRRIRRVRRRVDHALVRAGRQLGRFACLRFRLTVGTGGMLLGLFALRLAEKDVDLFARLALLVLLHRLPLAIFGRRLLQHRQPSVIVHASVRVQLPAFELQRQCCRDDDSHRCHQYRKLHFDTLMDGRRVQ